MSRRLLQGPTRFQTAYDRVPPHWSIERDPIAANQRNGADRQRKVERPPHFHAEEVRGRNTDDVEGMIGQRESAPDDVGATPIFPLPESMTDHQTRRTASPLIVLKCEQSPHYG